VRQGPLFGECPRLGVLASVRGQGRTPKCELEFDSVSRKRARPRNAGSLGLAAGDSQGRCRLRPATRLRSCHR